MEILPICEEHLSHGPFVQVAIIPASNFVIRAANSCAFEVNDVAGNANLAVSRPSLFVRDLCA